MNAALLLTLVLAQTTGGPGGPAPKWVRPEPSTLKKVYGLRHAFELSEFELLKNNQEEWTRPYVSADGVRMFAGARTGRLECREVGTGELLWYRNDLGAIGASMGEFRGQLVVGSDSSLLLLEQQLGQDRKKVDLSGAIGGRLTITGTVAIIPIRPNLVMAVDLVAGQELWRYKRATPDGITVRGQAAPTVDPVSRKVYAGYSDGALVALSLDKGTPLWTAQLGNARDFFADVDTQPLLVDGRAALIAASYNGGLYKLDASNGRPIWKQEIFRILGLAQASPGLLVASDGDGQVLGLFEATGKVRWRYKLKHGAPTEPVALGRSLVAVGASNGPLAILDVEEGQPVQLFNPGSGLSVAPYVRDQDLVIMTNKAGFLALRYGEGR